MLANRLPLSFRCEAHAHVRTYACRHTHTFTLSPFLSLPLPLSASLPGYSIFTVVGELPQCEADLILSHTTVVQSQPPLLLSDVPKSGKTKHETSITSLQLEQALEASRVQLEEDQQLQAALRASVETASDAAQSSATRASLTDAEMARALQASLDAVCVPSSSSSQVSAESQSAAQPSLEQLRQQRQAFYE